MTSTLFPAKETYVAEAILADEAGVTLDHRSANDAEHSSMADKASLEAEVKTLTEEVDTALPS